jgi:hypothetical protein
VVPRDFWRRELNDVVLVSPAATVRVDAVDFTRRAAGSETKGFRAR